MEYKKDDGPWGTATAQTLETLAPGTYFVRVSAIDATLQSDEAQVIINAGEPEFIEGTLADDTNAVSLSGQFTNDATWQVNIIAAYEINIINGDYSAKLNLVFSVGSKYNGKTYTIYHEKKNGETENHTAIRKDGKVAIEIDELSPFLIAMDSHKDSDPPETGDNINLLLWLILSALSAAALMLAFFSNKRKFSNNL